MKVFKKLGSVVIYYFLASLIDQIAMTFFGNEFVSLFIAAASITVISCYLRKAEIIKRNYLQEQGDEYNRSFKSRFEHIVSGLDFKVEAVIGVIVAILFGVIPSLATGVSLGFIIFYMALGPFSALLYIALFIIIDFFIWYFAYYLSFRKKKY